MRITSIARRYASALFDAARDAGAIDAVESDLGLVTYSLAGIPALREALANPLIPIDTKKRVLRDVFGEKIDPITDDFLMLLVEKRREDVVEEVEQEFVRLADEYSGVAAAEVTTAFPLTEEEVRALEGKLNAFTGKQVQLEITQDASIIGGVVVKIGDTIIDGSIRGYLEALREKLSGS